MTKVAYGKPRYIAHTLVASFIDVTDLVTEEDGKIVFDRDEVEDTFWKLARKKTRRGVEISAQIEEEK